MGVTGELPPEPGTKPDVPAPDASQKRGEAQEQPADSFLPELENLFKEAGKKKVKANDVDAFWNQAAEKHGNLPASPEVLTYEQARKLGLTPDKKKQ
jgi:hypothetical protein